MKTLLVTLMLSTLIFIRIFDHIFSVFSKGLGIDGMVIHTFAIPFAIGSVLVVLLFDFHTAITFSLILSLMSGIWLKSSLMPIYVFIGCLIGAFTLIRCKRRTDIINAGIYIAIANIVSSIALLFIMEEFSFSMFYFSSLFFCY